MNALPRLFERFHGSVLAGNAELAAADIRDGGSLSVPQRLAIYSEGYRLRLLQAVASDYPALRVYLGGEGFDSLAAAYIEQTPPMHFNLDRYPHGFTGFVARQCADRFACDLARLEGAIAEVFMGTESAPFAVGDIAPGAFAATVLRPRAASRLMAFDYPVHDWLTGQRAGDTPCAPLPEASFLYLYRHRHEVQRAPLSEAAYAFLTALFSGQPVGDALDTVRGVTDAEMQIWFSHWMGTGFFAGN